MLSHLRFHRRDRSNPTSPVPDNGGHWDHAPQPNSQDDGLSPAELRTHPDDVLPFHSSAALSPSQTSPIQSQFQNAAPRLPPITRVTSGESDMAVALESAAGEESPNHSARSPYNEESPFIGGLALENYRREQKSASSTTLDNPNTLIGSAPLGRLPTRPLNNATNSFVSPTDLQKNMAPTGRRQAGSSLAPGPSAPTARADAHDAPKTKKGLPFLKNPMSTLLMRRKTSQNDLSNQQRNATHEQPANDPRIRGTRVHDFSEPRTRKPVPISHAPGSYVAGKQARSDPASAAEQKLPQSPQPPAPPPKDDISKPVQRTPTDSSQETLASPDRPVRSGTLKFAQHQHAPETIKKQQSVISTGRGNSTRTSAHLSRDASIAEVISSVPKHMKSVSSRFSFDMIASAEEEKILEERHRQRQQDKPAEDFSGGNRDSRFDDFDDASFDYDALDYDDGLEERIPGVNADMEDDFDDYNDFNDGFDSLGDPDNDQENFAGFAFQRSDASSSLPDPLRIAEHNAAHTPVAEQSLDPQTPTHDPLEQSSQVLTEIPVDSDLSVGLGIQAHEPIPNSKDAATLDLPQQQTAEEQPMADRILDKDDELYFKGDDFDGEGDGSHFDESLFDLDDTDQYGRPIPGLFARALSKRNEEEEAKKRESDMTSHLSAQTALSENTAHTSVSMHPGTGAVGVSGNRTLPLEAKNQLDSGLEPAEEQDQMAAYQAALAAATYKAVASGKFERDDSPSPPPADLMVTSPTTTQSSQTKVDDNLDDNGFYDDDYASAGLEDYELDDDAIIAEANASALANDSEGWYGHEFGFYSAQTAQHQNSAAKESDDPAHSQYGGVFAPSGGLDRSTSGRVLREPNLTPITERSEYSNRNSMMSLHLPPGANHNAPIQSPGLAQLAMMADDEHMSLQSLMRLRSRAWGGSQASLASSREASPCEKNEAASPGGPELSNFLGATPNHGRKNSTYSTWSQDSVGPASGSGSPTLTLSMDPVPNSEIPPIGASPSGQAGNIPHPGPSPSIAGAPFSPSQPSSACPPVFEDEEGDEDDRASKPAGSMRAISIAATSSTLSNKTNNEDGGSMVPRVGQASQKRPGMGHKHRSSADSISYRKETEEDSGETRWVLERRRTGDSGKMEIEQEVLPGRI